jgi:hypothetical protein
MAVRNWRMLTLCLLSASLTGCTLWHDLQPYRLNRLNRVPPPTLDPEFSQVAPTGENLLTGADEVFESTIIRAQNP